MLSTIQNLATRLYKYRLPYFCFGALVFMLLAYLDFNGSETTWLFMLSFLWFFFIAMFVGMFREKAEELQSYNGLAPEWVEEMVQKKGFKVYLLSVFLFCFSILTVITVRAL